MTSLHSLFKTLVWESQFNLIASSVALKIILEKKISYSIYINIILFQDIKDIN